MNNKYINNNNSNNFYGCKKLNNYMFKRRIKMNNFKSY